MLAEKTINVYCIKAAEIWELPALVIGLPWSINRPRAGVWSLEIKFSKAGFGAWRWLGRNLDGQHKHMSTTGGTAQRAQHPDSRSLPSGRAHDYKESFQTDNGISHFWGKFTEWLTKLTSSCRVCVHGTIHRITNNKQSSARDDFRPWTWRKDPELSKFSN
jgi:hypothetical protein